MKGWTPFHWDLSKPISSIWSAGLVFCALTVHMNSQKGVNSQLHEITLKACKACIVGLIQINSFNCRLIHLRADQPWLRIYLLGRGRKSIIMQCLVILNVFVLSKVYVFCMFKQVSITMSVGSCWFHTGRLWLSYVPLLNVTNGKATSVHPSGEQLQIIRKYDTAKGDYHSIEIFTIKIRLWYGSGVCWYQPRTSNTWHVVGPATCCTTQSHIITTDCRPGH